MVGGKPTNAEINVWLRFMSILDLKLEVDEQKGVVNNGQLSAYNPDEKTKLVRGMIVNHFQQGNVTMYKPRVEFNDLSVINRAMVDQMSFNTYQPNNGQAPQGDEINAWKSRAIRPIVRNKCISIAAHATARLIFPKVFAYNQQSDADEDAAQVMEDLMEWSADQSNYPVTSLYATLAALVNPASIVYSEYSEVYREVKREKQADGTYRKEQLLDETLSGFQDQVVPVDQLYIENFYEPDIQKQGWLLWRRVMDFELLKEKYGHLENFQYVNPGVQLLYNDANQSFYQVYDTYMRPNMGEEFIYWNRGMDLKITMVNGVMLSEAENPNPRNDKLYPFVKFGYEPINDRCFYYKSLAFKVSHDANIINTLYPMIIDGTYLNLMPPMVVSGSEAIGADVIVPGAVTTLSSPDAKLNPIGVSQNLQAGMNTLFKVDESLSQSSEIPPVPQTNKGQETAYEISIRAQERNTILGMFIQMISSYVKAFGKLRIGDFVQYLTIAEVGEITDNPELVYKSFLIHNKQSGGKVVTRKIMFDSSLPSKPISEKEKLKLSYDTLKKQGGRDSKTELYRMNPELARKLKYMVMVSPDVMSPMSEEVERAFNLEAYDKAVANPLLDQETVTKKLLLGSYRATRGNVDEFFKKPSLMAPANPMDAMKQLSGNQPMPMAPTGMSAVGAMPMQK